MKDYTKIPNQILRASQINISARYLYCVLVRYCGNKEWCFPSQTTLAEDLGCSSRQIRNLIRQLEDAGLVFKVRKGFNRSNNYKVAKSLSYDRKDISPSSETSSIKMGNQIPFS